MVLHQKSIFVENKGPFFRHKKQTYVFMFTYFYFYNIICMMSGFWKPQTDQQQQHQRIPQQQRHNNNDNDDNEKEVISYRRLRQNLDDYKQQNNDVRNNNNKNDDDVIYSMSTIQQQQQQMLLPIYKHRKQIVYAVEHYGIVVIVGETGCGKSTQIPQYLIEYGGWCENDFQIVCTQPRRIAAITLAQRVQYEMESIHNNNQKNRVGYTVRFDDTTIPYVTQLKYVTDGILIREALILDPLLSKYSIIMIDEAHERHLNTDILLGLLKKIRMKRPELRIIICSATINAISILQYFAPHNSYNNNSTNNNNINNNKSSHNNDKTHHDNRRKRKQSEMENDQNDHNKNYLHEGTIISVDGRQHPVDTLFVADPVSNYIDKMIDVAYNIHHRHQNHINDNNSGDGGGDILCFLPSSEQIDHAIQLAEERFFHHNNDDNTNSNNKRHKDKYNVDFIPLHGNLPYVQQKKIFEIKDHNKKKRRRIIFATNIAETSITVPNITYVIDSGLVKLPYYDPITHLERLILCPISQASANQRSGRAGRITPGICYRLYTELYYNESMPIHTPPEILRTNLSHFILILKSLGIDHIFTFDLLDMPSIDSLIHGLETLYALNAMDDDTQLTQLGINMSILPTEPRISRMILQSIHNECTWEILAIASVLQIGRDLFIQPKRNNNNNNNKTQRDYDYIDMISNIMDRSGDHVTYVNLFQEIDEYRYNEKECYEKFINYYSIKRGIEIRNQLGQLLKKQFGYKKISSINSMRTTRTTNKTTSKNNHNVSSAELIRSQKIRKCILYGYFSNIAKLGNDGRYYTIRKNILVTPCPSSMIHIDNHSTDILTNEHYNSRHFDNADNNDRNSNNEYHRSEYIMFHESYDSTRGGNNTNTIELKHVSYIDAKWLREIAPHYWE